MNRTLRKCCAALLAILAVYAAPAAEKTVYLKETTVDWTRERIRV